MKFEGKPSETWAVVAGIEKYTGGWDLNGPAHDAKQFMELLLAWNVPPEQIFARLSPLPANADVETWCRNANIDLKTAARNDIEDLLMEDLPKRLSDLQNQLLFLFWGGHGIVTEKIHRRLYYADASTGQKRNVVVDSLLQLLQSQRYAPVSVEIAVIDACANYYEELRSDVEVKGGEIGGDVTTAFGIKQCVLYGASNGQVAANAKSGKFSSFVLGELKKQNAFPGDFIQIHDAARAWFDDPRNAGETRQSPMLFVADISELRQTRKGAIPVPRSLQAAARQMELSAEQAAAIAKAIAECPSMQDRAKRDAVVGALPADVRGAIVLRHEDAERDMENMVAATLSKQSSLQALFGLLRQVENDRNAIEIAQRKADRLLRIAGAGAVLATVELTQVEQRLLYRASMPDSRLAPEPRDADHILELLDETPREDGVNRMHEFLERVNQRVNQKAQHAGLVEWLGNVLNVPKAEIAAIHQRLASERAGKKQPRCYLTIAINTLELKPNETPHLRTWLWRQMPDSPDPEDDWVEPCDASRPEGIQEAFRNVLANARSRAGSQLALEFIVPREQLCLAPENWKIQLDKYKKAPLGKAFPVILRWRDRILDPRSPLTIDWSNRASVIRARLSAGAPSMLWVEAGTYDGFGIRTKLQQLDCPECIGLLFMPPEAPDDFEEDLLVQALAAGAPFLCWLNGQPENPAALKQSLAEEIAAGLDDAPFALHEDRARGGAMGASTSIVWDDPAHMPQILRARPV